MAQSRRERFVAEYIISQNATEAAQKAGYSARSAYSTGHRLLKKAEISAKIEKAQQERLKRLQIDADYVLKGIQECIDRCMGREPTLDRNGNETGEFEFNARDALKGYELLGRHLKLFVDRIEVDDQRTITEIERELARLGLAEEKDSSIPAEADPNAFVN